MAHSRLALTTMFDWIERCLADDGPLPTDGQICERYGFDSLEKARGLLADLADAGKITIRGFGDDRIIAIGRAKSAVSAIGRVEPAVRKVDPDVERLTARLMEIARRGPKPGAPTLPPRAKPIAKVEPAKPVEPRKQSREETDMTDRSKINFGGDALDAIKRHAEAHDVSMAAAAAVLVERGAAKAEAAPIATTPPERWTLDVLLDAMRARFAEQEQHSVDAAIADVTARAETAEARANAAEARLAKLRDALAA